ncbi:unnamed protein product [Rotaria socialis]|uniref:Uncharacterized protein n=2 Tax=Rotaria socialis TaxID=392032 RepID=A0A821MLT2_9BILA|nr:unnamed protein product [Rotaria socialis]
MLMTEPTNLDKSSSQRLLTANINIDNFQSEQILSDRSGLPVNDNKISDQKELVIIDEVETEIILNISNENRALISTNMTMDHNYDMATIDSATVNVHSSNKSSKKMMSRYLPAWEKQT